MERGPFSTSRSPLNRSRHADGKSAAACGGGAWASGELFTPGIPPKPAGILSKLPPSQQIPPFLLVPPPTGKSPQHCGSFSYPPLSLSPSISVSLALWEMKYSQLRLRSGRAAAGLAEQTEEPRTCEADGVRFV